jgi:hypothetical protein
LRALVVIGGAVPRPATPRETGKGGTFVAMSGRRDADGEASSEFDVCSAIQGNGLTNHPLSSAPILMYPWRWQREVLATIQEKLNVTYRGITLYLHHHHIINLSSAVKQNPSSIPGQQQNDM